MAPMTLPPGFRFHPTDEELVAYYLDRKITGRSIELEIIPEVDLYKCEPWDLPDKSYLPSRDMEWYFYSPRDRKYPNGSRTNRATRAGYWKATGKDRAVCSLKKPVGMKKTLVYYRGRAPHGIRTNWVMHEYRLVQSASSSTVSSLKDSYALCRVFKKAINVPKTEVHKAGSENELSVWALKDNLLISDIETSGRRGNGEDNLDGEYSKFPSETSSSDLTDGIPANEIASANDLQAPLTSDEANSSSELYPLHADSFLNQIQDIQMPDCTSLQHQLPYPPLALEDFPQISMEKTKTLKLEHVNGYMNYKEYTEYITDTSITLEEIFSLCSSQETSIVLPMQD